MNILEKITDNQYKRNQEYSDVMLRYSNENELMEEIDENVGLNKVKIENFAGMQDFHLSNRE